MKLRYHNRQVTFEVQDDCLVRTITGMASDGRGTQYIHRCSRQTYETVARLLAETPRQGVGTSMPILARQHDLPYSQVDVALDFFKDRGIAQVRHRRCYPGRRDPFLDALCEYAALEFDCQQR